MRNQKSIIVAVTLFISIFQLEVLAKKQYLDSYKSNPYHKANYENCGLCHNNSAGGGSLNSFGNYYSSHGHSFSRSLMSAYPQFFKVPPGGFLTNVSWNITSNYLTPTKNGSMVINLLNKPASLKTSTLKYKIIASTSVTKYLSFSSITGEISFDELNNPVANNIVLIPKALLASSGIKRALAKKPMAFKVYVYPYDNDGTTLLKDQGKQITFYAHSD